MVVSIVWIVPDLRHRIRIRVWVVMGRRRGVRMHAVVVRIRRIQIKIRRRWLMRRVVRLLQIVRRRRVALHVRLPMRVPRWLVLRSMRMIRRWYPYGVIGESSACGCC